MQISNNIVRNKLDWNNFTYMLLITKNLHFTVMLIVENIEIFN